MVIILDVVDRAWKVLYSTRRLRRADRIVVSTPAMIEQSPFLKPFAGKCVVIPYGIDVDYWKKLDDADLRRIGELRALHPRLIVATGRLVAYKGFNVLIEAMRRVDGTLVIIGTGALESDLRAQIAEVGIGDRINLVGYLKRRELKCLLHACRVFTMPSVEESETFGIAQVACILQVVATILRTGDFSPGHCGLLELPQTHESQFTEIT